MFLGSECLLKHLLLFVCFLIHHIPNPVIEPVQDTRDAIEDSWFESLKILQNQKGISTIVSKTGSSCHVVQETVLLKSVSVREVRVKDIIFIGIELIEVQIVVSSQ